MEWISIFFFLNIELQTTTATTNKKYRKQNQRGKKWKKTQKKRIPTSGR